MLYIIIILAVGIGAAIDHVQPQLKARFRLHPQLGILMMTAGVAAVGICVVANNFSVADYLFCGCDRSAGNIADCVAGISAIDGKSGNIGK